MKPLHRKILINMQPWCRDHSLAGQPVLPAVESLVLLAEAAQTFYPKIDTRQMQDGRFARFLELPVGRQQIEVTVELEKVENGLRAELHSRQQVGKFFRRLEHARVFFSHQPDCTKITKITEPTANTANDDRYHPAGQPFTVAKEDIYKKLIPFGSSYQNVLTADLFADGVIATLRTPNITLPQTSALAGSPFLLDAAFQAACIWGQRFTDFMPFPVGFKKRRILQTARPGQLYQGRIAAIGHSKNELLFDLDILDQDRTRVEQVQGLQMRAISKDRIKSL